MKLKLSVAALKVEEWFAKSDTVTFINDEGDEYVRNITNGEAMTSILIGMSVTCAIAALAFTL